MTKTTNIHYRVVTAATFKYNGKRISWWSRYLKTRYAATIAIQTFGGATWYSGRGGWWDNLNHQVVIEHTVIFELGAFTACFEGSLRESMVLFAEKIRQQFEQDSVYLICPNGEAILVKQPQYITGVLR